MNDLQNILRTTQVYNCLNCGKCTANCPLSIVGSSYSPRKTVNRVAMLNDEQNPGLSEELEGYGGADIWSCLTCGDCEAVCPVPVDYTGFLREVRGVAQAEQSEVPQSAKASGARCSHQAIFHLLPQLQESPYLKQNRLEWITPDLKTSREGEVVLFVGCSPYYDLVFSELGVSSTASARGAIALLNRLGLEPAVLADERCCGHDRYWNGDMVGFKHLAERNVEALKGAGAKTVLTTCPECYLALKDLYPSILGEAPFEVMHFYDFLLNRREEIEFKSDAETVTFHDPCRLSKHLGIYNSPRELMALAGQELREMPRSGENSVCCGTPGWNNCGLASKRIQKERLEEATATGTKTLVTACPKCLIHLSCAQKDEATDLEILDLTDLLSRSLPENS